MVLEGSSVIFLKNFMIIHYLLLKEMEITGRGGLVVLEENKANSGCKFQSNSQKRLQKSSSANCEFILMLSNFARTKSRFTPTNFVPTED